VPLARVEAPLISLDRRSRVPIFRQIYQTIREGILSGRWLPNEVLPSSRALADGLKLSRNTVQQAYLQLLEDGFLESKIGSGTRVARTLPHMLSTRVQAFSADASRNVPLSRRGELLAGACSAIVGDVPVLAFRPSVPALDAFPYDLWSRMLARTARTDIKEFDRCRDSAGYAPLREAIAMNLRATRSVRCNADNVIVTDGTQQALDLATRLLLDEGDTIWVEDPGYSGARSVFFAAGLKVSPVPVDDEGLVVHAARIRFPTARAAYTSPSHQYPMGSTMSLSRRLSLLAWAQQVGAWVFEDDYDSEYRYGGQPVPALQGLDEMGRVIYFGSFSKVMLPSLRLGYIVAPSNLAASFANARAATTRYAAAIPQIAMTHFMREGHLASHIYKMRALYSDRQSALLAAAHQHLPDMLELRPSNAGMHLTGFLADGLDDRVASTDAWQLGIIARALSNDAIEAQPRGGLVLGYSATSASTIVEGIGTLKRALSAQLKRSSRRRRESPTSSSPTSLVPDLRV